MKKQQYFGGLAALLLLATAAPLLAETNFAGQWKMNAARSNFGAIPPPASMERSVTQQGTAITLRTVQTTARGEMKSEYKFTTDGKEFTQQTRTGEVKGAARWQGDTLIVETRRSVQGAEITSTDRWSLSDGGKAMTVDVTMTTPQGSAQMSIVLDKQ